MKKLFVVFLVALSAGAQTQTVTVKGPRNTKTTTINIGPAPQILSLSCTPTDVFEGDPVTCTVTVDRPAPVSSAGATLYTFPVLGVPGPLTVTIPPGTMTGTFTFNASIPVTPGAPKVASNPFMMPMRANAKGVDAGLPLGLQFVMFYRQVVK